MPLAPLVLIVDDHPDNREAYAEYLDYRGYRTLQAGTGAEAIAAVIRDRPDVVLLDLKLPDIHGLEVSRYVRSHEQTRGSRVIALSACVFASDVSEALENGCESFLEKPCLPETVVSEIERILSARIAPPAPSPTQPA